MTTCPERNLIVVGASAGDGDALKPLRPRAPGGPRRGRLRRPAPRQHLAQSAARVLERVTDLRVEPAADGALLERGVVHVARPDVHLVIVDDRIRLGEGPRENGHRPSLDVLLRSAAIAYGRRAVGVVLTGMLDDGAAGLRRIDRYGGTALVQDPDDADFPSMPQAALRPCPTPGAPHWPTSPRKR